jgi:hypothetical protein
MKRTCLAVAVALALAVPLGMTAEGEQSRTITAETLASQPAGSRYALDQRVGSDYTVAADVASRVTLRIMARELTVSDLARLLGLSGNTFEVVTVLGPGRGVNVPDTVAYAWCPKTPGGSCSCVGGKNGRDCKDLVKSGSCVANAASGYNTLVCTKKLTFGPYQGRQGCACLHKDVKM